MRKGFTLIELLIVIGIVAILGTIVVLTINPAELLRQGRDAKRLAELNLINSAINFALVDEPDISLGVPKTIYVSLPDTAANCANLALPSPPAWTYACKPENDYRRNDGGGWLPINFQDLSVSPLAVLPVDPTNSAAKGLYYIYVTGSSWILTSMLESEKYLKQLALDDDGTDDGRFERGSDFQLWSDASGLVGYWRFDEAGGTAASDSSGQGNSGALVGAPIPTWTTGKVKGALSFDRTGAGTNRVEVPQSASINNLALGMTIMMWINLNSWDTGEYADQIIQKGLDTTTMTIAWYYLGGTGPLPEEVGLLRPYATIGGAWGFAEGFHPDLNTWYHVAVTYNGSSFIAYKNGEETGRWGRAGGIAENSVDLDIGRGWHGTIDGLLDEVRVYNRALSEAEIQAIYNATK